MGKFITPRRTKFADGESVYDGPYGDDIRWLSNYAGLWQTDKADLRDKLALLYIGLSVRRYTVIGWVPVAICALGIIAGIVRNSTFIGVGSLIAIPAYIIIFVLLRSAFHRLAVRRVNSSVDTRHIVDVHEKSTSLSMQQLMIAVDATSHDEMARWLRRHQEMYGQLIDGLVTDDKVSAAEKVLAQAKGLDSERQRQLRDFIASKAVLTAGRIHRSEQAIRDAEARESARQADEVLSLGQRELEARAAIDMTDESHAA